MKKIFLAALMTASISIGVVGCASQAPSSIAGKVISCVDVPLDKSVVKGIELECLDGTSSAYFQSLRGPTVVNVWGSWCAPCLDEMPEFVDFYKQAKGKVALIGIAVEERSVADSRKFIKANGITWPNFYDTENKTGSVFGMGVPVTWFLDEFGEVKYKKIGVIQDKIELVQLTAKYLGVKL